MPKYCPIELAIGHLVMAGINVEVIREPVPGVSSPVLFIRDIDAPAETDRIAPALRDGASYVVKWEIVQDYIDSNGDSNQCGSLV